jgi:hypothetical protein
MIPYTMYIMLTRILFVRHGQTAFKQMLSWLTATKTVPGSCYLGQIVCRVEFGDTPLIAPSASTPTVGTKLWVSSSINARGFLGFVYQIIVIVPYFASPGSIKLPPLLTSDEVRANVALTLHYVEKKRAMSTGVMSINFSTRKSLYARFQCSCSAIVRVLAGSRDCKL